MGCIMKNEIVILLVDDDKGDRELLKTFLSMDDQVTYRFIEVASAKEAYSIYCSNPEYDCVLLDFFMDDMTGIELLECLKKESVPLCPTILISGHLNQQIVDKAYELGVRAHLSKDEGDYYKRVAGTISSVCNDAGGSDKHSMRG